MDEYDFYRCRGVSEDVISEIKKRELTLEEIGERRGILHQLNENGRISDMFFLFCNDFLRICSEIERLRYGERTDPEGKNPKYTSLAIRFQFLHNFKEPFESGYVHPFREFPKHYRLLVEHVEDFIRKSFEEIEAERQSILKVREAVK